MEKEIHKQGWT